MGFVLGEDGALTSRATEVEECDDEADDDGAVDAAVVMEALPRLGPVHVPLWVSSLDRLCDLE